MQHKFSRTERLIGDTGLTTLSHSSVMLFGIGGVGSFTAEALARAGVGHLILVDSDDICLTNINRQLHALHSTVGMSKVDVMKQRISDINPEAKVEAVKAFYTPDQSDLFLERKLDYVIDAIDTISGKVSLAKECLTRQIPFISSMGAGNRLTAAGYKVADISETSGDPLAKAMRKLLRKEGINRGIKVVFSPELPLDPISLSTACSSSCNCPDEGIPHPQRQQTPGSISFVPSVVGLLIAGEVIRDLLIKK